MKTGRGELYLRRKLQNEEDLIQTLKEVEKERSEWRGRGSAEVYGGGDMKREDGGGRAGGGGEEQKEEEEAVEGTDAGERWREI